MPARDTGMAVPDISDPLAHIVSATSNAEVKAKAMAGKGRVADALEILLKEMKHLQALKEHHPEYYSSIKHERLRELFHSLTVVEESFGRRDSAIKFYQKLERLGLASPQTHLNLSALLIKMDKYQDALAVARVGLASVYPSVIPGDSPSNKIVAMLLFNIAICEDNLCLFDDAEASFRRALAISQSDTTLSTLSKDISRSFQALRHEGKQAPPLVPKPPSPNVRVPGSKSGRREGHSPQIRSIEDYSHLLRRLSMTRFNVGILQPAVQEDEFQTRVRATIMPSSAHARANAHWVDRYECRMGLKIACVGACAGKNVALKKIQIDFPPQKKGEAVGIYKGDFPRIPDVSPPFHVILPRDESRTEVVLLDALTGVFRSPSSIEFIKVVDFQHYFFRVWDTHAAIAEMALSTAIVRGVFGSNARRGDTIDEKYLTPEECIRMYAKEPAPPASGRTSPKRTYFQGFLGWKDENQCEILEAGECELPPKRKTQQVRIAEVPLESPIPEGSGSPTSSVERIRLDIVSSRLEDIPESITEYVNTRSTTNEKAPYGNIVAVVQALRVATLPNGDNHVLRLLEAVEELQHKHSEVSPTSFLGNSRKYLTIINLPERKEVSDEFVSQCKIGIARVFEVEPSQVKVLSIVPYHKKCRITFKLIDLTIAQLERIEGQNQYLSGEELSYRIQDMCPLEGADEEEVEEHDKWISNELRSLSVSVIPFRSAPSRESKSPAVDTRALADALTQIQDKEGLEMAPLQSTQSLSAESDKSQASFDDLAGGGLGPIATAFRAVVQEEGRARRAAVRESRESWIAIVEGATMAFRLLNAQTQMFLQRHEIVHAERIARVNAYPIFA